VKSITVLVVCEKDFLYDLNMYQVLIYIKMRTIHKNCVS